MWFFLLLFFFHSAKKNNNISKVTNKWKKKQHKNNNISNKTAHAGEERKQECRNVWVHRIVCPSALNWKQHNERVAAWFVLYIHIQKYSHGYA